MPGVAYEKKVSEHQEKSEKKRGMKGIRSNMAFMA